jgi:outer membrane lipoprotein
MLPAVSRAAALLAVVPLLACPAPRLLRGEFIRTTVADAQRGGHEGEHVRWGGTIVETRPERGRTCIEIVSRRLDRRARPQPGDESDGRFEACAPAFYDPEIYAADREVTVIGTIAGTRAGRVGEYDYSFPAVDVEVLHLWPERPRYDDRVYYPSGVYVGPLWYPFWWGGWHGRPARRGGATGHRPQR